MTDITITDNVAERLQRLAQHTHRTVEEILEKALDTYMAAEDIDTAVTPPPGSLARMASIAVQNPIEVEAVDIAENSREILHKC